MKDCNGKTLHVGDIVQSTLTGSELRVEELRDRGYIGVSLYMRDAMPGKDGPMRWVRQAGTYYASDMVLVRSVKTHTTTTTTHEFAITALELRRAICDYFNIMDPKTLTLSSTTTLPLIPEEPDDAHVLTARWTTKRETSE